MTTQPPRWDLDVDLVCVGSGLGGLTAAIVGLDQGCSVAVLEKGGRMGGVCAYSGGEVFVPDNHKMRQASLPEDPSNGRDYLDFLAGGYADPDLRDILLEQGKIAAEYLEEHAGVKWKVINAFPDYHHPHAPGTVSQGRYLEVERFPGAELGEWASKTYAMSPHMPPGITHDEIFSWGSFSSVMKWDFGLMGARLSKDERTLGPGMMAYFVKAAFIDRQAQGLIKTPVQRLVVDDQGRVIGVLAKRDGQDFWVRARRGVVLAIGGYDWHPDFPKYYEGLPEWNSMCQPWIEGDNIVLGSEAGAVLAGVPSYNLGMFFGYSIPGEEHEGKPLFRASWEGGYPHALWVNRTGKRFADEAFYRDYLPRCHDWEGKTQTHPNYPPFLIFDQNFRDKYSLGPLMPGMPMPESLVTKADTPRELAEKLGIDPAGLEATLARFNPAAERGEDPEFGRGRYPWAAMMIGDPDRPNPNLGPLNKPPYYGLALKPVGVGVNAVGLKTDQNAQVVHVRGNPIPGLYAVGNSAAALDTGAGYQSGLSNLRGMTWGFIAAKHASGD